MTPAKPRITAAAPKAVMIRPLVRDDIDAVVGIDKAVAGHSRRGFYEKRLTHLTREPTAFIALAAELRRELVGFALARLYEGEFGSDAPAAALDAIGVAAEARHHGVGRGLVDAMMAAMRIHSINELSTEVDWTNTDLAGFFARMGFLPAPRLVLERDTGAVTTRLPTRRKAERSAEIDFSSPSGDDFDALAHDRTPIRSMTAGDFAAILNIDRRFTGRDRTAYFRHKLAETIDESGVRVSLVAETDSTVAGFVMACVEFGEFGSIEPEAVIDTIGVDTDRSHKGIGTALVSQLVTNLAGLRVESVRTEVGWNQFGLLSFLERLGFRPQSRLSLRRQVR